MSGPGGHLDQEAGDGLLAHGRRGGRRESLHGKEGRRERGTGEMGVTKGVGEITTFLEWTDTHVVHYIRTAGNFVSDSFMLKMTNFC